ncbi:MAG: hypothetical protein V1934_02850 [Methanobacteriota archaeon]
MWLAAALLGGIAVCVWSDNAKAYGAELVLEVTPNKFYQDTPTDVTVVVRDLSGNPVAGASVYFGIYDVSAYGPVADSWTLAQFGSSLGTTDATGTVRTTYTPTYGTPMHLIIEAETGPTEAGYVDIALGDEPGSGFDPIDALKKYGFLMACLIVVPVTLGGWYSSTSATKKRFENAKLKGFNKKVEDPDCGADPMKHPEGDEIFKSFKEGLRENKESKLFITNRLLKSFEVEKVNKHYGGYLRGDEEVEYFSTEVNEQRISDKYKLHEDPKPVVPTKFTSEDDVQTFPISEKIDGCGRCKATGHITCDKCKGDSKKQCPVCQGTGRSRCEKCWGFGYYTTTPSSQPGGKWLTTGASFGTPHAIKCEKCDGKGKARCQPCDGRGYFPCEKCDGTGKMTCTLCLGDKQTRHLTCKVWRYKHEKLRQLHGPEEQNINPDRFDEIDGTLQPGPSLDSSEPAPAYPSEDAAATPFIKVIVDSTRNSYNKWKGRAKGRVVLDKHELLLSPITDLDIAYPSKGGDKTFHVWALGNPKAYVLDAGETPTQLTSRYAARHAAFALVVLGELAFFVYAQIYWHVLW